MGGVGVRMMRRQAMAITPPRIVLDWLRAGRLLDPTDVEDWHRHGGPAEERSGEEQLVLALIQLAVEDWRRHRGRCRYELRGEHQIGGDVACQACRFLFDHERDGQAWSFAAMCSAFGLDVADVRRRLCARVDVALRCQSCHHAPQHDGVLLDWPSRRTRYRKRAARRATLIYSRRTYVPPR